jgi:hypothetical protein
VVRHLSNNLAETKASAVLALNKLARTWNADATIGDKAISTLTGGIDPSEMAKRSWCEYVELVGAEILSASSVPASDLFSRYEQVLPPFEDKKDKKHEFPDAIALLTLEAWAIENNAKVLAVSHDVGWQKFCDDSHHLVMMQDLSQALALFQNEANNQQVRAIARTIVPDDRLKLKSSIEDALKRQAWKISFDIEADSQFSVEGEAHEVTFKELDEDMLRDVDNFSLVEASPTGDHLVISVTISVTFAVECSFSFSHWDGVDKEYIGMGHGSATRDETVDVEVLITATKEERGFEIDEVDVLETSATIEFFGVEPDWMNEGDD